MHFVNNAHNVDVAKLSYVILDIFENFLLSKNLILRYCYCQTGSIVFSTSLCLHCSKQGNKGLKWFMFTFVCHSTLHTGCRGVAIPTSRVRCPARSMRFFCILSRVWVCGAVVVFDFYNTNASATLGSEQCMNVLLSNMTIRFLYTGYFFF